MNRVNLLSTDQSSSEVKMTTTGFSTTSGSTRTKAAKGLFSHFMFLASLLLITLLTSGKALAQTSYNVTLADAEGCGLTVSPNTTDGSETKFTLTAKEAGTHKAPTEGVTVDMVGTDPVEFTYEEGAITITSGITGDITITAVAETKSTDATLSDLTYSGAEGPAITLEGGKFAYTVELTEFVADETDITVTPTVTATDLATASPVTVTYTGTETVATITVTAENTDVTQNYTITFKSKDKLATITPIEVAQLGARYDDLS